MSHHSKKKLEFRVIAGSLKGQKVVLPDLGVTRPPLSRLRKAVFDYLNPRLAGASYLDLFSGTGSYLFEALSRGAAKVLGIELEPLLAGAVNEQASRLGVADGFYCRCEDVFTVIPGLSADGERFDIIMIAPPQYQGLVDRTLQTILRHPLSAPDGRIICQHDSSETQAIDFSGYKIMQQRRYGNTTFSIVQPVSDWQYHSTGK